jgi:hypothetical protein
MGMFFVSIFSISGFDLRKAYRFAGTVVRTSLCSTGKQGKWSKY